MLVVSQRLQSERLLKSARNLRRRLVISVGKPEHEGERIRSWQSFEGVSTTVALSTKPRRSTSIAFNRHEVAGDLYLFIHVITSI